MDKTSGLGEIGRIRSGHVDTGERIFHDMSMVSAKLVRRGLTNAGFRLDDVHWFIKLAKPGKQTKCVVNLAFSAAKGGSIAEYNRETTEAMRSLASTAWFCHVWLNPGGVVTANFVGLQQGEPRQQLVVRDGVLTIVSTGAEGPGSNGGVDLEDVETVLVKFYFTNPRRIPAGIRQIDRPSDDEMDRRHAASEK